MKYAIKILAAVMMLGLASVSQAGVVKYEVSENGVAYAEIKNSIAVYHRARTYPGVVDERMKNRARKANMTEAKKQCASFSHHRVAKAETSYCVEASSKNGIARRTCYVKNAFLCK